MKLDDLCIKLLLYTLYLESDTNTHTHLPQDILYKPGLVNTQSSVAERMVLVKRFGVVHKHQE